MTSCCTMMVKPFAVLISEVFTSPQTYFSFHLGLSFGTFAAR